MHRRTFTHAFGINNTLSEITLFFLSKPFNNFLKMLKTLVSI